MDERPGASGARAQITPTVRVVPRRLPIIVAFASLPLLIFCAPDELAAQNAPEAVDDSYTVEEGDRKTRLLVLENDEAGSGTLRITDVSKPDQGGRVSLHERDTEIEYEPAGKFTGIETFTYEIRNSDGLTDTATVTVTVRPKNSKPVFTSSPETSVNEDIAYVYEIAATDSDGDPLEFAVPLRPAWLDTFADNGDGTAMLSGIPEQADAGDHEVMITVTDGIVDEPVEQKFRIKVIPVNEAPVAEPDAYDGNESTTLSVNVGIGVLANDVDPDGDDLEAVLDEDVSNGTLSLKSDGAFTYTPNDGFSGADGFVYFASDGELSSGPIRVTLTIGSVNDPPSFASSPPLMAIEGSLYAYAVEATDPDGDALTITAPARPAWLDTFIDNGDGTAVLSGTPGNADVGGHDVVVAVSDGIAPPLQQAFRVVVGEIGSADVSLAIAAAPSPALVDETVEWTLTIANPSPEIRVDEITLDAVFSGASFVLESTGGCLADGPMLSCVLGPIAPDSSLTVTVTGRAIQSGDVLVFGEIGSPIAGGIVLVDPNPENDSTFATLNVGSSFSSGPAQTITGGSAIQGLAAGDVDGDGFTDLVAATGIGSSTRIHLSVPMYPDDPNGQDVRRLSAAPIALGDTGNASQHAALADLDNDDDLDLVVANGMPGNPQANALFVNDLVAGQANLVAAGLLGEGTSQAVAAADIDNNGFRDLVFANSGANEVFLNLGGTFIAAPSLGDADSRALAIADFDGDLNADIVFADADGEGKAYPGLGDGRFGTPVPVNSVAAIAVRATDLNGDGRPDLVFGISSAKKREPVSNRVFLNTSQIGSISFLGPVALLGTSPTLEVATADFSLDGRTDIVSLNETGTHQIFNGAPDGSFTLGLQQFSSELPTGVAVADFNNDGRPDLAVSRLEAIDIFLNDGYGNLGTGDTDAPMLRLVGAPSIDLEVGESYSDPGATATDAVDGDVSERIVVTNAANPAVIGTYVVVYDVTDRSGNKAASVSREVTVRAREAAGGGGGGSIGLIEIALLILVCGLGAGRHDMRRTRSR